MRRSVFFFFMILILAQCHKSVYQKEEVIVTGTSEPVISLNGIWQFSASPSADFQNGNLSDVGWNDILVPGEPAMQGFSIKHDIPFAYRKEVMIPDDFRGKKIKIRFEGVYSYARLWVNGIYTGDHSGGFTAWEYDISKMVEPGKNALIALEVTDFRNELSYGSGYAKHQIGGILRGVSLIASPANSPERVFVSTDLDQKFRNALLNIRIISDLDEKTWVGFRMYDPKGNQVRLNDRRYILRNDTFEISFPVKDPVLWDAEHPNLYTLFVEVFDRSIRTASYRYRIGMRKTEIRGNKLLVNGREVKLRGACRHDIHPLLGRVSTPEYDLKDVLLAKEANINFIRTSHYPPSESFLRYCDEYGIFVEDESAVCFVDTHRGREYSSVSQSGDEFSARQQSQLEEMFLNHFNHPSVIIWSLGNESRYNINFQKGYDYLKSVDPGRPVIFSYPGTVPDSVRCYDILSLHYPSYEGNIEQWGISASKFSYPDMPVIYDEWAHVACYNKPELLADMNVRNFWGESLDRMWSGLFESDGGTGGAIWGMIDETFMLPDTLKGYNEWWGIQEETNGISMYEGPAVGYGEWGIIDTWRRKKPEFWNTKKAYSPVRITIDEITDYRGGGILSIPVQNRFSHTSLREIRAEWTYRGKTNLARFRNIEPMEKGDLLLPPLQWREGEFVRIRFFQNDTSLIDEYNLRIGRKEPLLPPALTTGVTIKENNPGRAGFEGRSFSGEINKRTGLIENLVANGDTMIISGPYLHLRYASKDHWSVVPITEIQEKWKPDRVILSTDSGFVDLRTSGHYGRVTLDLDIRIGGNGIVKINYRAGGLPEGSGAEEIGLKFLAGNNYDTLKWNRNSIWNTWPAEHIGMKDGVADLRRKNQNTYREEPAGPWEYDNKSFYYNGLESSESLSFIASSMKEYILTYSLITGKGSALEVNSDGTDGCRISKDSQGDLLLYINSLWDYNSLKWGNYSKNIKLPGQLTDTLHLKIY